MEKSTNLKLAVSCGIRYILSAVITFFVYLSVTVVAIGFFTNNIGYTAYQVNETTNESKELYRYYYADGEDTKLSEYQEQGISVTTVAIRSQLSGNPKLFTDILAQTIGAVVTVAFIGSVLRKVGDADANLVSLGHKKYDKFRGFKIGLVAAIPYAVAYLVAWMAKLRIVPGSWYALFRFMNYQVFMFINAVFGQSTSTAVDLSVLQMVLGSLTVIIIPVIAHIVYILGYKRISFGDRIMYKNNNRG